MKISSEESIIKNVGYIEIKDKCFNYCKLINILEIFDYSELFVIYKIDNQDKKADFIKKEVDKLERLFNNKTDIIIGNKIGDMKSKSPLMSIAYNEISFIIKIHKNKIAIMLNSYLYPLDKTKKKLNEIFQ